MYTLTHEGDTIGTTKLERGDPSIQSVSGEFFNVGGAKALAGWIKSIGGAEDDGVVFITLNSDFTLVNTNGDEVRFAEGNLISIPQDDEVYLDITGISDEDYKTFFAGHLTAMNSDN